MNIHDKIAHKIMFGAKGDVSLVQAGNTLFQSKEYGNLTDRHGNVLARIAADGWIVTAEGCNYYLSFIAHPKDPFVRHVDRLLVQLPVCA